MKRTPVVIALAVLLGMSFLTAGEGESVQAVPPGGALCADGPVTLGGVDLGCLTDNLFVFADGSEDANWQAASKGYVGNVVVRGTVADERSSGSFAYAGTIVTDDVTLDGWERIIENNPTQAAAAYGETVYVDALVATLDLAIAQASALPVTPGFEDRSSESLDGLDTTNGTDETIVVNVTSDLKVTDQIDVTGDAGDIYILRWDEDANPLNGFDGKVKFQSGGAIVPHGAIGPGNFIHVAGVLNASGGGDTPASPFPQGPRLEDGTLIDGAKDFDGGGFFTGYWLTTGDPEDGENGSMSNAIFVGGWYTTNTKFSLTSGSSGVRVAPPMIDDPNDDDDPTN